MCGCTTFSAFPFFVALGSFDSFCKAQGGQHLQQQIAQLHEVGCWCWDGREWLAWRGFGDWLVTGCQGYQGLTGGRGGKGKLGAPAQKCPVSIPDCLDGWVPEQMQPHTFIDRS